MSLLAILYHLVPESPILVAYNHEDTVGNDWTIPAIHSGKPRVLASVDPKTGGTYLGVNQNGMLVAALPRRKNSENTNLESRNALVRLLLRNPSARRGAEVAMEELAGNEYEGANLMIVDSDSGWVIHAGDRPKCMELERGLSVISNCDVNDRSDERIAMANRLLTLQNLDSPIKFLAVASKVFARGQSVPGRPSMVVKGNNFATVSSTLVALGKKPRDAIYQYSCGSPDEAKYEDYSPMLRDILSRGIREARIKANV